MRKVLSFVLVLSLVLGSFGMAFAAPLSDIAGKDFEDAVNVLTELGVVKGYPDGTFKPDNIVTRAEMAVIAVSALGLKDYAVSGTSKFSDMGGHWSNPFVAYATSLGIISGYPDGTFKPDKTVSYDEAATMLVAALGYTPDSLVGSWPTNYVSKAKTLDILDGIKAGAAGANRGDIAIMTFQTLGKAIGKTNKDGDFVQTNLGTIAAPVDDTMLSRLGADLYNPGGSLAAGDPFVLTDGLADNAIANVRDYVGAYVTAYVNDDGDIIAIKDVKSTFLEGEVTKVTAGVIEKFKADGVEYTVDRVDYDNAAKVVTLTNEFTNGDDQGVRYVGYAKDDALTIAVKVSGKHVKEMYSISTWASDDEFYFEKDMLEDDNLNGHKFAMTDDDEIDLGSFELLGADSLDKIAEDDVIYVYIHATRGEINKIEVGTKTVSGEVTKVNSAGDTFTIDGVAYSEGAGYIGTDPAAGDEVKLILDYAGDVYDVDKITSADTYAVVISTKDGTSGTFGTTPEIELLLADGTSKAFKAKPTKIADATIITTAGGVYTWQDGAGDKVQPGSIVKYGLNSDGEITTITALTEVVSKMDAGSKLSAAGYYNGAKVKSDATIIVYDGSVAFTNAAFFPGLSVLDADDFKTTTLDKILDTTTLCAYYVVNSGGQINFMVIDSGAVVSDAVYGVAVGNGTNNSDAGFYVDVLIDGAKQTYDAAAAYANRTLLHEINFDTKGVATLTPVGAGNSQNGTIALQVGKTEFKLSINSNYVVDNNLLVANVATTGKFDALTTGAPFTLDKDVKVYVWDATKYTIGKFTDLKAELTAAEFIDVDADADFDGAVDIVLITKK